MPSSIAFQDCLLPFRLSLFPSLYVVEVEVADLLSKYVTLQGHISNATENVWIIPSRSPELWRHICCCLGDISTSLLKGYLTFNCQRE